MFKMKKVAGALALTIALAQVATAVPVQAAELYDCYHEECDNKQEWGENYLCNECNYDFGYVKADETHHVWFEDCLNCEYEYTSTYPYECYDDNNNSKCDVCEDEDTVFTCTHDKCETVVDFPYSTCGSCNESTEMMYVVPEDDDVNCPKEEKHIIVIWCEDCDAEIDSWGEYHSDNDVDGICDKCKYETGVYDCPHINCDNDAGIYRLCGECAEATEYTYEKIDDVCHTYAFTCECGDEYSSEEPHFNWMNGLCICEAEYDDSTDEGGNGTTGNGGSNGGTTGTGNGGSTEGTGNGGSTGGNGYFDYTDTTVVEVFKNVKSTSTVAGVTSTVNGAYILEQGVALAITTPVATIAQAFNLAAGETPYVKAFDMDVKKSNLAFASLEIAAKAFGGTNVAFIQMEFGKMSAKGVYSLLPAGSEIQAMFSIPAKAQVAGAKYAVIRVVEGGAFTLLKDTDNNPATVSFVTTGGAGAYAIIRF